MNYNNSFDSKRFKSYIISKVIYLIPVNLIAWFVNSAFSGDSLNIFGSDKNDVSILLYIFLSFFVIAPSLATLFFLFKGAEFIYMLVPVLIAYSIVEFLFSMLNSSKICGKMFAFKFVAVSPQMSINKMNLLTRAVIKYVSIFVFPLLLYPMFNKEKLFLHETASGVKKVIRFNKIFKKTTFIDDDEKKFYEEQSENQC